MHLFSLFFTASFIMLKDLLIASNASARFSFIMFK
jgi:hypothetical protein